MVMVLPNFDSQHLGLGFPQWMNPCPSAVHLGPGVLFDSPVQACYEGEILEVFTENKKETEWAIHQINSNYIIKKVLFLRSFSTLYLKK